LHVKKIVYIFEVNNQTMKQIVIRNFKTAKGQRVTKGTELTIMPLVGVTNRVDLVQIVGKNFTMNTLKSTAIKLTTLEK